MEVQAPSRQLEREQKTVFSRQATGAPLPKTNVCSFWLAGRYNRNPCRFLNSRMPLSEISEPKQSKNLPQKHKVFPKSRTWRRETNSLSGSYLTTSTRSPSKTGRSCKRKSIYKSPTQPPKNGESHKKHCICESPAKPPSIIDDSHKKNDLCESPTQPSSETEVSHNKKSISKSCNTVCNCSCAHGEKCEFLHKWSFGKGFSLVTKLEGHENAITGVASSPSSNKLVTGKDKTMRIWDGNNGQCLNLDIFDDEITCMTAKGSFIFMGMQNTIKGLDTQNNLRISLSGSSYKVTVIAVEGDKIFAGTENGSILVWKANASGYLEISEPLMGHKDAVVCIRIGAGGRRIFSGSRDNTIRVRDLNNMECMETLYGHTSTFTSLLCWDTYLLSGLSDRTIKGTAKIKNCCNLYSESSHVFTCIVESQWDKDSMTQMRSARLHLVDLAGSEKAEEFWCRGY